MRSFMDKLRFKLDISLPSRMEKLARRSKSTKAKIIGTALSITGVCVVTMYNGPPVMLPHLHGSFSNLDHPNALKLRVFSKWLVGGFFLAAEYLLLPITYIIQVQILKEYPAELPVVFLYNASVMILSCIAALLLEANSFGWKLRVDVDLAAILYSGFFGKTICTLIHTWGLRIKGPVYIAMFRPLSIAVATVTTFIFLDETLHIKRSNSYICWILCNAMGEKQKKSQ